MRRAMAKLQGKMTSKCFDQWKTRIQNKKRRRALMRRTKLQWMNRNKAAAFRGWLANARSKKRF